MTTVSSTLPYAPPPPAPPYPQPEPQVNPSPLLSFAPPFSSPSSPSFPLTRKRREQNTPFQLNVQTKPRCAMASVPSSPRRSEEPAAEPRHPRAPPRLPHPPPQANRPRRPQLCRARPQHLLRLPVENRRLRHRLASSCPAVTCIAFLVSRCISATSRRSFSLSLMCY